MRFILKTSSSFRQLAAVWGVLSGIWILSASAADFQSPRTMALGGAGHANPLLSDAIYVNPSFISFMQTHSLSLYYLNYGNGTVQGPTGPTDFYGHNLNLSVMDGSPDSLFQAGFGYTRKEDSSVISVSAGKGFFQGMGVGVGTKFIFLNNSSGRRITDAIISTTGVFTSWFQSSLIIDNIFESASDQNLYRDYIIGTRFNIPGILSIYLDPHWTPSLPGGQEPWGYEAGIEFPFFSDFYLRAGTFKSSYVSYQSRRGDGYGLGIGWIAPKISMDYSYGRVLRDLPTDSHQFGFTIYF